MARGRIRARIRRSHLYTFGGCLRPTTTEEVPHPLQGPGYSRTVYCNQPQLLEKNSLFYCKNDVSTTKYNVITFFPKALFEQFRRVANIYFLLAACLSASPISPFSPLSMIAPLAFVVGLSMAKEALEDSRRFFQDVKVNRRKASLHKGNGIFGLRSWQKIMVGDVVKVEKDQFFPADLLLLASSYEDGICYVETMNLDGETNLKVKRSLEATLSLDNDGAFKDFSGTIRCEDPNPDLYTFVGNFEYEHQVYPLDPGQILLRDSKLRNTDHVYGVVIFTGHDSKVMQNSTKSPSKRSTIEKKMDYIIYTLFTVLISISFISSIGFVAKTKYQTPKWWYLRPDNIEYQFDPGKLGLAGMSHLITALILYGYLIPISLYVSIEFVKVLQATFINQDIQMYDDESGTPAEARTSNLNEELGQVDTILSDKTGTLTCNQMDFLKCSIAGTAYGVCSSEVELAAAKQMASDLEEQELDLSNFPMRKESNVQWENITEDEETELGTVVTSRDDGAQYKILNLLDFTSKRKRMSVIVRDEEGNIILFCKGADSIIFDRLSKNGKMCLEATTRHLNEYGEAGLRTLALAYRKLDDQEYSDWNNEFQKAKTAVGSEREAMLEQVSDIMERELILVGATAVEDKLQKGVPQCIDKLAQAGLKIWVLTGDKMETAINIGFACSLLRQGMKQICITMNSDSVTNDGKEVIKGNILSQITNASQMIKLEKDPHAAFALIIDGKTLTYALEDDVKHQFLGLAVTRLVKEGTGKTTLAIGDGANDVGMIQEADIGVGISGVEGMQHVTFVEVVELKLANSFQAVMASDFAIAQFRFLERLLVVHGHWCYKRIAQMICYFFYKNIAFGLTILYFEAFAGFSGQSVYDDWYMILFNVFLTSLPVISLGVFEQDVPSEVCLQFPALYQQGPKNLFFDWYRILGWMGNGLYSSLVIFFLVIIIFYDQAFRVNGQIADMAAVGTMMFTCIIWAVNCQIALTMSHFTWIQHLVVWGSITTWYIFLLLYGMLPPQYSKSAYQLLIEVLAPAPIYWTATLLVTIACVLPYLAHISFQRCFNPMDHHIIQEIKYYKKDIEDQHMWTRERSKARQVTKIGFTARVEAKIRHFKGKLQKKQQSSLGALSPS
ncbi:hypothetical protein JHK82_041192 [Glycine max]|nr:hypothetical protein JHK86_041256 [Glycine max]KAG5104222.1 hypothetical protein JHK82_041192 [Glycine max]